MDFSNWYNKNISELMVDSHSKEAKNISSESWNAAINAVLNLENETLVDFTDYSRSEIKSLKFE